MFRRHTHHNPAPESPAGEHADSPLGPPVQTLGKRVGYFELSSRPLMMLVFLLPLIIAYEVGSVLFLTSNESTADGILARRLLAQVFELFGAVGLVLPGLMVITVLGLQHILRRDPWRVHLGVLPLMVLEALVLTAPLLVLAVALGSGITAAAATGSPAATLLDLPWTDRLTIAIGAGVYEELVFRLMLITLVHFVVVDLIGRRDGLGRFLGVVLSALAFAVYHDLNPDGQGIDLRRLAFFFAAGVYFGVLFLWRGLGMPVAVHVVYDVLVLLVLVDEPAG
ncbi:MAG: CPBP family intramembrane glutamic endopeptidase [Planctomycetota bacterium]